MRASQAQINQDVAVALERVLGRLENMEQWRKEIDDERRVLERRQIDRVDRGIQIDLPKLAILISLASTLLMLWNMTHH